MKPILKALLITLAVFGGMFIVIGLCMLLNKLIGDELAMIVYFALAGLSMFFMLWHNFRKDIK